MTGWGGSSLVVRRGAKVLLDQVTVRLEPGAVTAILGPNGSGKTTLMRVLAGLENPVSGVVGGEETGKWREPQWARTVAFVQGADAEEIPFSVEEMLLSAFYPDGGRWVDPSPALRKPLVEILSRLEVFPGGAGVGLGQAYSTLSAGERQLVDVARGILQKTPVLLLDEPTSALDLRHRLLVRDLLREEAQNHGRTVALSLHDLGDVDNSVSKVLVLKGGTVAGKGNPSEVLTPDLLASVWGVVSDGNRYALL